MSLLQYLRFLAVGVVTALATVLAREFFDWALGADTIARYGISIVLAYALGILMSYALNRRLTFAAGAGSPLRLLRFVSVALLGMLCTALLAFGLRYGLPADEVLGRFAPTLAFAMAALLSSLITYPLNARVVFKPVSSTRIG